MENECKTLRAKNGWFKEENARLKKKFEVVAEERDEWKKKCQAESNANAELLLEIKQLREANTARDEDLARANKAGNERLQQELRDTQERLRTVKKEKLQIEKADLIARD